MTTPSTTSSSQPQSQPWYTRKYNEYYTSWMPWLEEKYLSWYGENKTSYTAKQQLKTDVTGVEPVNKLQDGLAEGVGGQFSQGGLLGGVGEGVSKQGVDRVERDEHGQAVGQGRGWVEGMSGGLLGGGGGGKK